MNEPTSAHPNTTDEAQLAREFDLFERLMTLDSQQRERELDDLSQSNPSLAARARQLLHAHEDTGSGVLDVLPDASKPRVCDVAEGTKIGPYKTLQLIGSGGMGQVFMAEQQQPIRRRIAIKMLHSHLTSKNVMARFEAERVALSRLDHPGIARILDAGQTDQGRSFFVMELVRGKPITKYCDRERLAVSERLKLFEEVCQAIHHAHQKGIIHRDIKPSNVLVTVKDGSPTIKVIDFGIAKAVDEPLTNKTMFTRFGELVGTPVYMSPEQLEGGAEDVDVRSDVYSLGALLYELLTGVPPFRVDSEQGLLRTLENLRDAEPTRPSFQVTSSLNDATIEDIADRRQSTRPGLQKFLRGELDWICLKALAKAPSQRYDSATALAADVRRFLNHEPIEAVAPTWAYKARKLFQKHRSVCLLSGFSVVALMTATALMSYLAISASNANQQLVDKSNELKSEVLARRETEQQLKNAEQTARQFARERQNEAAISRAISQFLLEPSKNPIDRAMAFIVASEMQKKSIVVRYTPIMIDQSAKMSPEGAPVDGTPLDAGMAEKIADLVRESLSAQASQGSVPGNAPGNSPSVTVHSSTTTKSVGMENFNGVDHGELHSERIRLLRIVEQQQTQEFGDKDPFVAATSLRRAKVHLKANQPVEAELATRKALAIFQEHALTSEIQDCKQLLSQLAR